MPIFYFHLRTKDGIEMDDIGIELENAESAYLAACAAIPGISIELVRRKSSPLQYAFQVSNAEGHVYWEVPFGEALHLK